MTKSKTVLVGVALALAAGAAGAEVPTGTYAGTLAGQTKFTVSSPAGSEWRFTWGVFGGYRFNSYVAAELGYYKPSTWSETNGAETFSFSSNMLAASLLLGAPINDIFSAYARLGAAREKLKVSGYDGVETIAGSDSSTEKTYGVGLSLAFNKFSLRAEYTKVDAGYTDNDLISAGFVYSFRQ